MPPPHKNGIEKESWKREYEHALEKLAEERAVFFLWLFHAATSYPQGSTERAVVDRLIVDLLNGLPKKLWENGDVADLRQWALDVTREE